MVRFNKNDSDMLRVLASVSVVLAHCVHDWVSRFALTRNIISLEYLSCVVDQYTRFTVPLFLFLSGYGLTLQFEKKQYPLKQYYKFRLKKIMLPFIFLSLIVTYRHVGYIEKLDWSGNALGSFWDLFQFFFFTGFDYQLYFLIVIFQFYLIYPFIYRFKNSSLLLWGSLLLHLCFMSPVETYLHWMGLSLPKLHHNALVFYWLYCFAGVYVAANFDRFQKLVDRYSFKQAVSIWIFLFAFLNMEFAWGVLEQKKPIYYVDHFNRWSVVLFCMASLMLYTKSRHFLNREFYSLKYSRIIFTHIAPYTFFAYLCHTHFLRWADHQFPENNLFDMFRRVVIVVGGTYSGGYIIHWVFEKYPKFTFLFGLPGKEFNWKEFPLANILSQILPVYYGKKFMDSIHSLKVPGPLGRLLRLVLYLTLSSLLPLLWGFYRATGRSPAKSSENF